MLVNFFNNTNDNIDEIITLIKNLFDEIKEEHEFNIIFVDKDEIKNINTNYRNKDYVTDVISFPSDDIDDINYVGDIFLNLDKAYSQAKEYKHSIEREICFLSVHGYLHLIGYNHINDEDEKKMIKKQEELLDLVNLSRNR